MPEIPPSEIRDELERVLGSPQFARGEKLGRFLRYVVETTLDGRPHDLKEYEIGVRVYARREGYDPRTDSTVRVEAGRLRAKLLEYYTGPGSRDRIRIELPKGSYVPRFTAADTPEPERSAASRPRTHRAAAAGLGGLLAAGMLVWWVSRPSLRSRQPGSPNPAAREFFLEGHRLRSLAQNGARREPAIAAFQNAVHADPSFAGGWAALASTYDWAADTDLDHRGELLSEARKAARRAVILDDALPAPHKVLGALAFFHDWDLVEAARQLHRAAELDPGDAHTHFLYASALTVAGRFEEAEKHLAGAHLSAPGTSLMSSVRAQVYLAWGRYGPARDEAMRAIDLDPKSTFAHWVAGLASQMQGDLASAEREFEFCLRQNRLDGRAVAAMAHLRARQGRLEEAEAILRDARRRSDAREGWYYVHALIAMGAGKPEEAVADLEQSFEAREGSALYALTDRRFDGLRDHPRFQTLTSRIRR